MEKFKPEVLPDPWKQIMQTAKKIEAPAARAALMFDFGKTALEEGNLELAEKAVKRIENEALQNQLLGEIDRFKSEHK